MQKGPTQHNILYKTNNKAQCLASFTEQTHCPVKDINDENMLLLLQCQSLKACNIQILLCCFPSSATCLPTSPCGGTVSPSWHLHSSVCPTCICMNWGTCGRSSSMWQWEPSWPCKSNWGSRWAKHQTTTSDKDLKHKELTDPQSDVPHMQQRWHWSVWGQRSGRETKNLAASQFLFAASIVHRPQCGPKLMWSLLDWFWELSTPHHCSTNIFALTFF